MDLNNILGVVLAGGKSQRFGQDKSQVKLKGKLLIDYILTEIKGEFSETLIIANEKISFMSSNNISVTKDFKSGLGPLGGVLTAMKWIKQKNKKYKWISTFPSDTPFFEISIIEEYKKKTYINESLLYFVKSNNKRHNIFGLWSIELLKILENDLINNNFRKVEEWANKIGVKTIDIKITKFDPFFNINTKEDFEEAKKLLTNE